MANNKCYWERIKLNISNSLLHYDEIVHYVNLEVPADDESNEEMSEGM